MAVIALIMLIVSAMSCVTFAFNDRNVDEQEYDDMFLFHTCMGMSKNEEEK